MSSLCLYRICKWKVAWLLKHSYWDKIYDNDGRIYNPFSALPSSVIEELMECIIKLSTTGRVTVTELYHLLTSGRVENFRLYDLLLTSEEFVSIFMSLSVGCQNLRFLTLHNIFFSDQYLRIHKTKSYMKKAALECVLRMAPNLESVISCVEFDLKAIQSCDNLRVLKLKFISSNSLCNFLEEEDGLFMTHHNLTILEFLEDPGYQVPLLELAAFIKYCPALKEINTDICRSLEYLHGNQMIDGSLDARYNLQKCFLGNFFVPRAATLTAVHIATLTCPDMREVNMVVSDNNVIYALSDFENLKSLVIRWVPLLNGNLDSGDFKLGLAPLLNKIGENLTFLNINNFFDVNFAIIGSCCPHIHELRLKFLSENSDYDDSFEYFKELESLYLDLISPERSYGEEALLVLLSGCTNLNALRLRTAAGLNDGVLSKILRRNNLSKLKDCILVKCDLSDRGVNNLIMSSKNLDYLHFSSSHIKFEEAAGIVHQINPLVLMRSDLE
ncbi:uncharacterized protein TNCT_649061 [Trichonephila clavata]|uniref:F-box/LRR-repeat protein n=1 Tax=Trichonephila clavata TaxID=2740835 RepID=A0A8X6HA90_TRICU|nr:uncharacterized protein TNCT_649061 [Trichonephila clavata]